MSVFNQTTKSNATTAQSFSSFMASYPFGLVPYGTSGKNSKSFLVFRNGLVRSFGIFYATFDEQNLDFFYSKSEKSGSQKQEK